MDIPTTIDVEVIPPIVNISDLSDRELLELIVKRLDDMVTAFETVSGIVGQITESMQENGGGFGGLVKTLMQYR